MIAIIPFIIVPGVIILGAAWWLILRHRRSTLLPFLIIVAVVMFTLRLAGLSPLGFFVSYGRYMWLAVLAGIAAAVVRGIRGLGL